MKFILINFFNLIILLVNTSYAGVIYDSGDSIKKDGSSNSHENQFKIEQIVEELSDHYESVHCGKYDFRGTHFGVRCYGIPKTEMGGLIFDSGDSIEKDGSSNSQENYYKIEQIVEELSTHYEGVYCSKYDFRGTHFGVKCYGIPKTLDKN